MAAISANQDHQDQASKAKGSRLAGLALVHHALSTLHSPQEGEGVIQVSSALSSICISCHVIEARHTLDELMKTVVLRCSFITKT